MFCCLATLVNSFHSTAAQAASTAHELRCSVIVRKTCILFYRGRKSRTLYTPSIHCQPRNSDSWPLLESIKRSSNFINFFSQVTYHSIIVIHLMITSIWPAFQPRSLKSFTDNWQLYMTSLTGRILSYAFMYTTRRGKHVRPVRMIYNESIAVKFMIEYML